jgi:hypothetical protein
MCVILSSAMSNAYTVTVTPSSWATQAGLTVDRTLQDRHAGYRTGPINEEARDLLAAFDRAQDGADEAAAAGRCGVGVKEADEGVDVLGFPRLLEVPDDARLPGCQGRGSLGIVSAAVWRLVFTRAGSSAVAGTVCW